MRAGRGRKSSRTAIGARRPGFADLLSATGVRGDPLRYSVPRAASVSAPPAFLVFLRLDTAGLSVLTPYVSRG